MLRIHRAALAALVVTVLAAPALAQNVTQVEIQRLQDNIYQASTDVSQLRSRDASRATQLQTELDDLRDEVVYLKVKLRKERSLARTEYADVRDRIEDLRTRAQEDRFATYTPPAPAPARGTSGTTATTTARGALEIPAGTEIDVRLSNNLNSGTAQVEDRFEATTLVDLNVNGRTAVPAGSVMRGVVTAVEPATRTNRTARMTVSFDQVTVNGRAYPMRGTVTEAIEGEGIRGETARVGTGAGVGAIIGGILGGFKGALAGILIGAGGTIAATEGKEVELPQGSVLRVRVDSPVQINNAR
jgi:TolA-binding protein